MNWQENYQFYPKAWELFQGWWGENYPQFDWLMCNRELYDFFDEQGIYLEVYVVGISDKFKATKWNYDIANEQVDYLDYNSRTEAEEQAFLKAFEILEDRL